MMYNAKRTIVCLICFFIIFSSFSCFADDNKYQMSIDEERVVREIPREMYGINFEWGGYNNGAKYYLKPNSTEINPEFVKCYEGMIPLARMAGLSANSMLWKNSIGPLYSRKPITIWGVEIPKITYGVVEWIKSMQAVQPDVRFTYTVNVASDSYENLADLVEFLTGDGKTNYNGGVNWASERIKLGIPDPVDIFVFEIGNELDLENEALGINVKQYIELCKPAIAAIRSVKRDAVIGVHTATGKSTGWENWHRTLLQELGDEIDIITNHEYYDLDKVAFVEENYMKIVNDIKEITGSNRIKVYQSEHAGRRLNASTSGGYQFRMPHTMGGALDTAEFLMRAMWHPELIAATCHSTYSSSWSIAYAEDGTVKKTSIGNLLEMFNKNGCGQAVYSEFTDFVPCVETDAMGTAVKVEDGLNVFLVNQTDTAAEVNLSFKGEYLLQSYSYIQADSKEADNYEGLKEINVGEKQFDNPEKITNFVMPKYSITVLNLKNAK